MEEIIKQLRSRKTGLVHFISVKDYEKVKALGHANRFIVKDVAPVRQIVPTPKLDKPIIKGVTK